MRAFARRHAGPVILEIPLLYEVGWDRWLDKVIVVNSSQRRQLERLKRRNGLSRADALARLRAQWPLSRKVKRADYVLQNNGSRAALTRDAGTLARRLRGGK